MTDEAGRQLDMLRNELDALDVRLRESIRDRIEICSRVALVKREYDIPMMQPSRVGIVQQKAREFAREHDLSEEFLASVYDLLISEACRVEDLIIDADTPAGERGR